MVGMASLSDGSRGVGDPGPGVNGVLRTGGIIKQERGVSVPGGGAGGQTWSETEEARSAIFRA